MYIGPHANLVLTDSIFQGNSGNGGALAINGSPRVSIANTLFLNNKGDASDINLIASPTTISNCTFLNSTRAISAMHTPLTLLASSFSSLLSATDLVLLEQPPSLLLQANSFDNILARRTIHINGAQF